MLLTGDYVSRHPRYIEPGIEALGKLEARIGRFAVLGNHDHWEAAPAVRHALAEAGISLTDNMGFWLDRQGDRLRICGVGDLWTDRQDPQFALGDATTHDAVIMLSHNPDYAETIRDRRVGLILSGHTHGGQVVTPGVLWRPNRSLAIWSEVSAWPGSRANLPGLHYPGAPAPGSALRCGFSADRKSSRSP